MTCHGSRAVGTCSMMSAENVPPVVVFLVSTTGAEAVTVTSLAIAPTSIFMSTRALKPVVIVMSGRVAFLNPLSSNVTVYVPIGTLGKVYAPVAVVTAVCGGCSPRPLTVTLTPGNTAPVASVALPKICPIAWALADPASSKRTPAMSRPARTTRILVLLLHETKTSEPINAGESRRLVSLLHRLHPGPHIAGPVAYAHPTAIEMPRDDNSDASSRRSQRGGARR